MSEDGSLQAQLPLGNVGSRLREAREAAGMSLADIAAKTKIPMRTLISLEAGDYGAMASRAYAIGFARTYARAVGLDQNEIIDAVRSELATAGLGNEAATVDTFQPGDPSRVPSRRLAWVAALGAFAVIVAGYWLWRPFNVPSMTTPSLAVDHPQAQPASQTVAPPAAAATPDAKAPVTFTALDDGIWVKFYDKGGVQLLQKQLAKGESYTVPPSAVAPMLWTGRPDKLAVTVGGQPVAPISTLDRTVKDIEVSAAALLARPAPGVTAPATAPSAGPVPAASEIAPGLPASVPRAIPVEPR